MGEGRQAAKLASGLGELIRRGRAKHNLSQTRLAKKMGINPSHISRIESGERRPSTDLLRDLSEVLDIPMIELLVACGLVDGVVGQYGAGSPEVAELKDELRQLHHLVLETNAAVRSLQAGGAGVSGLLNIPVFDVVPAGLIESSSPSLDEAEGFIPLGSSLLDEDTSAFALNMVGDSMVDAGLLDGDTVVFSPGAAVESGDTVLVLLRNGETAVKTIYFEGGKAVLQAANKKYRPVFVNYPGDVEVLGKAILVLRRL